MSKIELTSEGLRGVWTALVTPFKGTRVNYQVFEDLIERAVAAELSGVVVLGTTGESPAVSEKEREQIIESAIRTASGRLAVVVGAGSNNIDHALHNVEQAIKLNADGLLIVTPYYNKPTQAGLNRYFRTLADSSSIPIVMYHIPARCGVGISIPLALELAQHPRIIGIKEAGGDVWRSSELARLAPDDFVILSGDDPLTLPLIAVGATGLISVASNIAPKMMRQMVDLALDGKREEALAIQRKLAPLTEALFLETNPGPIKEAMNLIGIDVGQVRPPLTRVSQSTRKSLKLALAEAGSIQ